MLIALAALMRASASANAAPVKACAARKRARAMRAFMGSPVGSSARSYAASPPARHGTKVPHGRPLAAAAVPFGHAPALPPARGARPGLLPAGGKGVRG